VSDGVDGRGSEWADYGADHGAESALFGGADYPIPTCPRSLRPASMVGESRNAPKRVDLAVANML